jgi:hypothetical protein
MRVQGWAGIDTVERTLIGERNENGSDANADIDVEYPNDLRKQR